MLWQWQSQQLDGGSKTENTADTQKNTETAIVNTESTVETEAVAETESIETAEAQEIVLGDGSVKITVIVVEADGNETNFVVSTDKETVGDALLELNLIRKVKKVIMVFM